MSKIKNVQLTEIEINAIQEALDFHLNYAKHHVFDYQQMMVIELTGKAFKVKTN